MLEPIVDAWAMMPDEGRGAYRITPCSFRRKRTPLGFSAKGPGNGQSVTSSSAPVVLNCAGPFW